MEPRTRPVGFPDEWLELCGKCNGTGSVDPNGGWFGCPVCKMFGWRFTDAGETAARLLASHLKDIMEIETYSSFS